MVEESNNKDEEFVQLLVDSGMSRNTAKALIFIISQGKGVRTIELERGTGLKQPDISISIQELKKKGWITKHDIQLEGKGKPTHEYILIKTPHKIIEEIENKEKKRITEIQANMIKLKQLIMKVKELQEE